MKNTDQNIAAWRNTPDTVKKIESWTHYDDKPKIRGVCFSLVVAFFAWMVASNLLAMTIYGIYRFMVFFSHNINGFTRAPFLQAYFSILLTAMFFDAFGHFTPFVAYLQCRVEPSLRQAVMFSLFGKRNWGDCKSNIFIIRGGS